jgi:hypothetical protein
MRIRLHAHWTILVQLASALGDLEPQAVESAPRAFNLRD